MNFDSIKISFFYFRFGIFALALVFIIKNNINFLKNFFISCLIVFSILVIDGYYEYFNGTNLIGLKTLTQGRVGSFFGEEAILGSFLSRLFPIMFGVFIFLKSDFNKPFLKYFIIIIFILVDALIFITGERTAFFLLNLSTIYIICLSRSLRKLRALILIISAFLILIIVNLNDTAKKRFIDRTFEQFTGKDQKIVNQSNDESNDKIKYVFSKQHHEHYLSALNIFFDNKLFGVGVKNFRKICKEDKYNYSKLTCSTHPHNTYIQLLSETGLLGFAYAFTAFVLILYYSIKQLNCNLKKKKYLNDFQICILSALFITLWPFVPTGNFFNNWLSIIYYLPVGILLSQLKLKPNF